MDAPFLLFDDGPRSRLYRNPHKVIAAASLDSVGPALAEVRVGLAAGHHAAGYLAYEAGDAFDPALRDGHRQDGGPLLLFALFDPPEAVDPAAWLPAPAGTVGAIRPRLERDAYEARVRQVREHLFAGDFYQVNLTFACDVEWAGDPLAIYAARRGAGGGAWGGVVRHDGRWLLSFSPEQFFTLKGGTLEARPMKGTGPLDQPPEALSGDPKQRAENLMIVDLLRNDLARVAEPGSVAVPELFAVETYPTLRQMVSRVTARLAAGRDAIDVLQTIFPCGSITGAPKLAAIRHLRALEDEPRGPYTGSLGWIEPGGDAAFNVLIRTLELADGAPLGRLGIGSGLVVGSEPAAEWDECLAKAAFLTRPTG